MPNRLADESSPYLLQHANNPVDWYPWASEALEKAKREDKPIFLSIGYSACHWCHVMEHESFENEEIANYLNEFFVNIKVDREERPDLDHIYMQTVSALRNGQGGWPLSAFLTPQRHVFFGGTYWPPTSRVGMPGFDSVIRHVHQAFREQREAVEQQSLQITGWLNDSLRPKRELSSWDRGLLNLAAAKMEQNFDFEQGLERNPSSRTRWICSFCFELEPMNPKPIRPKPPSRSTTSAASRWSKSISTRWLTEGSMTTWAVDSFVTAPIAIGCV